MKKGLKMPQAAVQAVLDRPVDREGGQKQTTSSKVNKLLLTWIASMRGMQDRANDANKEFEEVKKAAELAMAKAELLLART